MPTGPTASTQGGTITPGVSAIRIGAVILFVQACVIVGLELGRHSTLAKPFSGVGGAAAAAVVSTALLMAFLQLVLLRPLNQLLNVMNRVEQGDLARRLPIGDNSNAVDAWFQMFNRLVDRLSESLLLWDRSQVTGRIGSWTVELKDDEHRLHWSPGTCRIFGIETDNFDGRSSTFFSAVHPNDGERVRESVRQMTEQKREGNIDYRIRRPDGQMRWLHQHADVELGADGQPTRLIGIVQDITERKQVEEALRESEANLSAVVENTSDSILAIDDGYRILAANNGVAKNMGAVWRQDVATGKSILRQMSDDASAIWKPRFDRALNGERFLVEERYGEGTQTHDVEVRFNPIRNSEGIVGVSVFVRDITDRKKSENSLRESEERFRTLANAAPVGIFQTDQEGNCIYVNSTWSKMYGMIPQDALGEGWLRGLHEEDRDGVVQKWRASLERGCSHDAEYRIQLPNGNIRWIAGNAVPLPAKTGRHRGYIGTIVDVTEHRQRERQLSDLTQRVESIREEERKRISREIHDQLGQVLTVVKMNLIQVEGDVLQLPPDNQRNRLEESIVDATSMIDRSIETIRAIAMRIRPSILDELGLAAALQAECELFADRQEIPCNLNVAQPFPTLDDEIQTTLFRLAQEFLTNIARHAQAGEVNVDLKLNGQSVRLGVQDDGCGFDEAIAHARGHLGLVGARERAENLDGSLELITRPCEGTLVVVNIPIPETAGDVA